MTAAGPHTPPDLPGPDHRAEGPARTWFTARRRRHLYLTLVAAVPVAILYGVLTEEEAAAWLGLGAAVLGLGTAAANTPDDS